TQALYQLYQTKILPQQQAAIAEDRKFELQLSPTDQEWMNAEVAKMLAARPHIELEKLALRTANGESHLRIAVDLANPGPTDQPSAEVAKNAIGLLDAKVV